MSGISKADLKIMAERAKELGADSVFMEALDAIRTSAVDELVTIDAGNTTEVVRYQSIVIALDEIKAALSAIVTASGVNSGGYIPDTPDIKH